MSVSIRILKVHAPKTGSVTYRNTNTSNELREHPRNDIGVCFFLRLLFCELNLYRWYPFSAVLSKSGFLLFDVPSLSHHISVVSLANGWENMGTVIVNGFYWNDSAKGSDVCKSRRDITRCNINPISLAIVRSIYCSHFVWNAVLLAIVDWSIYLLNIWGARCQRISRSTWLFVVWKELSPLRDIFIFASRRNFTAE